MIRGIASLCVVVIGLLAARVAEARPEAKQLRSLPCDLDALSSAPFEHQPKSVDLRGRKVQGHSYGSSDWWGALEITCAPLEPSMEGAARTSLVSWMRDDAVESVAGRRVRGQRFFAPSCEGVQFDVVWGHEDNLVTRWRIFICGNMLYTVSLLATPALMDAGLGVLVDGVRVGPSRSKRRAPVVRLPPRPRRR